jgi:nitroimidazol reductase NimA-like FMN-containing flavoprotein (pyridoxamine 5'-phosphate oxidase superfamily)
MYQQLLKAECLELLEDHRFGRIAVIDDGRPLVFPVNYVLHDEAIVFRTNPGTKFAASVLGKVAFEIDGIDEEACTGWSVMLQGVGREFTWTTDERSERLRGLDVQPWVPGERVRWVEIPATVISGRRLRDRKAFEAPWDEM